MGYHERESGFASMRKLLSPWREKSYSWGNNEYTDYIIDAIGGQIEIGYVRSAKMSGVFYWGLDLTMEPRFGYMTPKPWSRNIY
jgi:hypothetical protein